MGIEHKETISKIEEVLNNQVRPKIQMDGGDIEFIKFEEGIVYVKLLGACVGCPISFFTLKLGVEEALKEQISVVQEVVAVE